MRDTAQLDFFRPPPCEPKRDWARPGLVDAGFVERSVAAMRDMPDAEQRLRRFMEETERSIREIDLVYGTEPNEWAAANRERLWLEFFTTQAILHRLKPGAKYKMMPR
jgi:hypothetical protein